jgi:hypothetical protein
MRGFASSLLFCAFIAGCGPSAPPPDPRLAALVDAYATESNETLWKRQATTDDSRELMMVEAELGTRAQLTDASGRFLGSRSAAGVGLVTYPRSAPITGERNCADFPNAAAAQRAFLAEGGPAVDPNGLDRDGDGNACGWGAQILTVSNRYQSQSSAAAHSLAPVGFEPASARRARTDAVAPSASRAAPAPVAPVPQAPRAVTAQSGGAGSYGAEQVYHQGPKGGCFYYAANSKVYVDRSYCR